LINDLADLIVELVKRKAKGVYNVAGRDRLSKYSFAEQLAQTFDHSTANIIRSRASKQQPDIARPDDLSLAYGKLERLIERPVPTVTEGLARLRLLEEVGWPEQLRKAVGGVQV
jgi:dTDP-4-dehydrorhamnose reductase